MSEVRDNAARSRFELEEDGRLAYADYRREGDVLVIPHVFADPALRGRGAAGRLMAGVARAARDGGLKIMPVCPYAATWMRRHPETADLLA
ncbi:MAG: N-acetyltransferase [Caulobacteraceae bacterium]|nr:N-acetyltransferase [Caulobacter sp.]